MTAGSWGGDNDSDWIPARRPTAMTPEDQAMARIVAQRLRNPGDWPKYTDGALADCIDALSDALDAATQPSPSATAGQAAGKPAGEMVTRTVYDNEVRMHAKAMAAWKTDCDSWRAAEQRVAELTADLRATSEEMDRRGEQLDDMSTALASLRQEASAQQAAAEGARGALDKYAVHIDGCYGSYRDSTNCKCGLNAALRPTATQPAAPKPIGEGGAKEVADDHAG